MKISKILHFLLLPAIWCVRLIFILYLKSVAVREVNPAVLKGRDEQGLIFLFWHSKNLFLTPYSKHPKTRFLTIQNLKHRLLQQIAGIEKSRRLVYSAPALAPFQVADALARGLSIAVPADGPYGPAGKLKPWILQVAKLSGAPIVPVQVDMPSSFRIPWRWDRFKLAWPSSSITITAAPPLKIESEIDDLLIKKIECSLGIP